MSQEELDPALEFLPQKTMAKILSVFFDESRRTKITATALDLCSLYLYLFCREAVWRSFGEHEKLHGKSTAASGDRTVALDVEDLERVAAALCLDFS